ncbi:hypothetical protein [Colwellia hornerae]|uniref:KfrA N-terminal DNA-binding domain-containing protein n=1 Tax=Colwellia hornerae TaxID=89402 RepID=A0A5C6QNV9_9GAMM|nr:hypothetical protein [Colwellia hornerae]TWX54569.1 hypothetical protein ESZ28_07570 [Colwellia hornerae]TWX61009.1 hypothetical protein ESZ26_06345 [Colwellia hornerae]TWX70262.1 hypothetical protein ESZ27_03835 [Colwellia hornerae]
MTITDEITIIANQLANQGKKPTVALLKTKLKKPIPLPTLISILRSWTHDPKLIELADKSKILVKENQTLASNAPEIELIVAKAIAKALQPIEIELAELKALVYSLKNNKS